MRDVSNIKYNRAVLAPDGILYFSRGKRFFPSPRKKIEGVYRILVLPEEEIRDFLKKRGLYKEEFTKGEFFFEYEVNRPQSCSRKRSYDWDDSRVDFDMGESGTRRWETAIGYTIRTWASEEAIQEAVDQWSLSPKFAQYWAELEEKLDSSSKALEKRQFEGAKSFSEGREKRALEILENAQNLGYETQVKETVIDDRWPEYKDYEVLFQNYSRDSVRKSRKLELEWFSTNFVHPGKPFAEKHQEMLELLEALEEHDKKKDKAAALRKAGKPVPRHLQ